MAVIKAEAVISAKDAGASKTFSQIAASMKPALDAAKAFSGIKMPDFSGTWGKSFQADLDRMHVGMRRQAQLAKEFAELQRAIHPSNFGGALKTHQYFAGLERWKSLTLSNLKQVRAEAEATNRALSPFARGALATVGAVAPAYIANRGLRQTVSASAILEREEARNWLAGLTPDEQKQAKSAAQEFSRRYQSIDQASIVARLRSLRGFTGSLESAIGLLENDLKALTVLQSLKGRDDAMAQFRELYRGLDILNFTEKTGDAQRLINAFLKAQSVDPDIHARDWALAARYSRSGGLALSDEFLGAILPTLIQDTGGAQVGTMLQQSIAQNVGNRIKKESKEYQALAGLRDKDGNFIGRDELLSNPYRWTQKYLPDALKKLGLDPNNHSDLTEFSAKAFSNTRVADFFTKLLAQKDQIERNIDLFNRAPGVSAANELRNRDPFVANEGLFAQLRNLGAQIATPIMESAVPALNAFSDAIANLTKRLHENPTLNNVVSGATAATGLAGTGAAAWWLASRYLPKGALPWIGRAAGAVAWPLGIAAGAYTGYELLNSLQSDDSKRIGVELEAEKLRRRAPTIWDSPLKRFLAPQSELPDTVTRSPLRIGDDRPTLNLGPLPPIGNLPVKADVSGTIDVKSNVNVSLDDNMLRVRVQQIVEPMLKNIQTNGNTTGTLGPLGRTSPDAEYHP